MKIGIIGCGYVGEALARFWIEKGHHISVTTRNSLRCPYLNTFVHDVHRLDLETISSFINSCERLIICVAPKSRCDYESTYLDVAEKVYTYLNPSIVHQMIYTSSTSVYGDHLGEWVYEETSLKATDENSKILIETENILLRCQKKNVRVCIFRLGEIYGPGREIEKKIHKMQHRSFAGDGSSYTNLIHLEDIIKSCDTALNKELNGVYNLCNDFHIPRKNFYDRICQKENLPPVKWDTNLPQQHQGNKRVSNEKLKSLGYTFSQPTYLF